MSKEIDEIRKDFENRTVEFTHIEHAPEMLNRADDEEDDVTASFKAGFKVGAASMASLGEVDVSEKFIDALFDTVMGLLADKRRKS